MDNKSILISVAVLALILIGVGAFNFYTPKGKNQPQPSITANTGFQIKTNGGKYIDYSEENLREASENEGKPVLFFYATWCPTCNALDKELKSNLDKLPEDVTVLKLDYDKEKELKNKYQITQQHTLVQVDKDGNEIKKWIGGGVETIKQQLGG